MLTRNGFVGFQGNGVPAELVASVKQLVSVSCGMCQRAMRAEGVKVRRGALAALVGTSRAACVQAGMHAGTVYMYIMCMHSDESEGAAEHAGMVYMFIMFTHSDESEGAAEQCTCSSKDLRPP